MTELVVLKGKNVFTDSKVIANGTQNQHESIVALLKKYESDFWEFGSLVFSDLKSGKRGRPTRIYFLNEEQAMLLMTFLDNTEIVRKFKKELVRQFYKMRTFILEKQSREHIEERAQNKVIRLAETDTIKEFVTYARSQGSSNAEWYYKSYTSMANKAVGISSVDYATTIQLNRLTLIENIITNQIRIGMEQKKYYKEIFKDCKKQIETFKAVAYLG